MAIPALPPMGAGGIGAVGAATPKPAAPAAGFGDAMKRGLEEVSGLENNADKVAETLASGGPATVHELMIANSKSSIAVDLLVQTRNRAVDAYSEIMRMQV